MKHEGIVKVSDSLFLCYFNLAYNLSKEFINYEAQNNLFFSLLYFKKLFYAFRLPYIDIASSIPLKFTTDPIIPTLGFRNLGCLGTKVAVSKDSVSTVCDAVVVTVVCN